MVALPPAAPPAPIKLPWQRGASSPLSADRDQILAFLRTTLADSIHLVSIVPDGSILGRWFGDDADGAMAWAVERNAEGANVYWTVNRVRAGLNGKPKKSDIVAARFTHVDIDPPKDGSAWKRDEVIAALAELDAPPSFVLDSGGGLQGFWRLDSEAMNLGAIEDINLGIRARFGADPCHNIDRLMRVPGTINFPDARKIARGRSPALAHVIEADDGTTHDPSELAIRFPKPTAPLPEARVETAAITVTTLLTADDLGIGPFDPVRMTIEQPPGRDRSRDAQACAGDMVRGGFSDEQIMGVLLNPANAVSAHCLGQSNPSRAAARCLSRARGDQAKREGEIAEGAAIAASMGIVAQPVTAMADRAIRATPYLGRAIADIPLRPWVYGRWFLRNTVTAVVAPGGVGKSALMSGTALALSTGMALHGKPVWDGPKTVWLWNLEDDGDELARQIEAASRHFEVGPAEYGDRLYVDSGLDGQGLCTAVEGHNGIVILRPVFEALAAEILARHVDVLIIDPFVSSHQVDENANTKIDAIAKEWGRLAKRCNCSIVLVHHAGKLSGKRVTSEASRGASALVAAARSTLVLNRLDDDQARALAIPPHEQRRIFSVGDDKHNRAPAEGDDWFRMISVNLGNGGIEGGDSVGVVTPWTPPQASEQVSASDLRRVQTAIASGSWRYDTRAKDSWVGNCVADVLGMTVETERARILELVKSWIADGALEIIQRKDGDYKTRSFVEVKTWVEKADPPVV